MEQQKNIIWKNSMTYGAILGGTLIVLMLITYALGRLEKAGSGLIDYVVTLSAIIIGTKTLRDKFQDGYITFGRALASGVLICVFAGVIYAPFQFLFFSKFAPDVFEKILILQEELLLKKFSEEQVEELMAAAQKQMTPISFAISGAITYGFIGLVLSLITSTFIKREPSPFDNTTSQEQN